MKTYICYYNCRFCPHPCVSAPCEVSNELIDAESKTEARKLFNAMKPCRWNKLTRIEETKPGFSDISATVNGETKSYATMGEAIDAICEAWF